MNYKEAYKELQKLYNEISSRLHEETEQRAKLQERIIEAIEYIKSFESIRAYYGYDDGEYSFYDYDDDFKEDLLEILSGNE